MKCKNCLAKSSDGCTVGVVPYYLRSGNLGCAWNIRIIQKHMNDLKPRTHFDWIKSLGVAEMANVLTDDWCEILCGSPSVCDGNCEEKMLSWLKAPEDVDK